MQNLFPVACLSLVAAVMLAVLPPVFADSPARLQDPGFEHVVPADEGGWRLFGASKFSNDHARQGNRAMLNGATSKAVAYPPYFIGMISGSYQELPATPDSRWRLTGYGMTPRVLAGTPAFGIVQLSFFAADGSDLGAVETRSTDESKAKLSNKITSSTPAGEWVFLDTGVATAPKGTATVQAFTLYVDYSGSSVFQGVYFDDLSLCAIDEGTDSACTKSAATEGR